MHSLNKHIDMSRFVALGDSLTAGYKDAALFYEGQMHAYPNLMAQEFHVPFNQPLLHPHSVGFGFFGNSRLILQKRNGDKLPSLTFAAPSGDLNAFSENIYPQQGPFNNMGVPGAKVINVVANGYGNYNNGAGNFNPYFFRMASDPQKASMLSDVMKEDPTFFSLFIGNNDLFAYAISGGTMDPITPVNGPVGKGFETSFRFIVDTLTSNGANGVICNLPSLGSLPLFNTIPPNGLLADVKSVTGLNKQFAGSGFTFSAGANFFLIEDATAKSGIRQIEKNEMISLDILLDDNKEDYLGGNRPIPENYYLSAAQVQEIDSAIKAYNTIIKTVASEKKLAFVDLNGHLRNIKKDRTYDNVYHNLHYKTSGLFALDGMHINALGHAVLANEFIDAINRTYKMYIPKVNITTFRKSNNVKTL